MKQAKIWASDIVRKLAPPSKEKSTLVALAEYADADGTHCFVSIDRIANDTGHSRRTVQRHIKTLSERGELRKQHQGHEHRTNDYRIVCCAPAFQEALPLPPARDPDERIEVRSPETLAIVKAVTEKLRMTGS